MRRIALFSAALLAISAPAVAAEFNFPARKAGQWEIQMTPDSGPAMTMALCLDEASDKDMMKFGMSLSEDMCATVNQSRDGNTIVIDATCAMGGMTTVSHTVMSGDFETAYDMTITSKIDGGPPGMPSESTITQHARWTGDCTGGLQPGDMQMPGGMKLNLKDAMGMIGGG